MERQQLLQSQRQDSDALPEISQFLSNPDPVIGLTLSVLVLVGEV